jgi:hypothetical protein
MDREQPKWPGATPFECKSRRHVWRIERTNYQGRDRISFWPWYRDDDGELKPGSGKAGRGGFFVPIERVPELVEALSQLGSESSAGPN